MVIRNSGGWRDQHKLEKEHNLNQQQDFDLGHKLNKADSKTESCKGYGADGYRIGKTSMALDYGTNAKHSNEGINVNLTVYLSSDYHLMETGIPIFR